MTLTTPVTIGPPREICPPSYRRWVEETTSKLDAWSKEFADWQQRLLFSTEMFRQHVHENPNASELDFRQHRTVIYDLLSDGEELIVDLFFLQKEGSADNEILRTRVPLIEQSLQKLRIELAEWHGDFGIENQLPTSFMKGMQDIEEGRIVDFEKAISEKPNR